MGRKSPRLAGSRNCTAQQRQDVCTAFVALSGHPSLFACADRCLQTRNHVCFTPASFDHDCTNHHRRGGSRPTRFGPGHGPGPRQSAVRHRCRPALWAATRQCADAACTSCADTGCAGRMGVGQTLWLSTSSELFLPAVPSATRLGQFRCVDVVGQGSLDATAGHLGRQRRAAGRLRSCLVAARWEATWRRAREPTSVSGSTTAKRSAWEPRCGVWHGDSDGFFAASRPTGTRCWLGRSYNVGPGAGGRLAGGQPRFARGQHQRRHLDAACWPPRPISARAFWPAAATTWIWSAAITSCDLDDDLSVFSNSQVHRPGWGCPRRNDHRCAR